MPAATADLTRPPRRAGVAGRRPRRLSAGLTLHGWLVPFTPATLPSAASLATQTVGPGNDFFGFSAAVSGMVYNTSLAAQLYEDWMYTPQAAAAIAGEGAYSTVLADPGPAGLPSFASIPKMPYIPLAGIPAADNASIQKAQKYWG
ncbi:MAG TPA: hypothetical protein VMI33_26290 [Streptosporangiaceae bacterium]|nr:hypothetical protein [Streptosporangiaceae bacterium]